MKKVYTLMAAAAVSMSMFAAPTGLQTVKVQKLPEAEKMASQLAELSVVRENHNTGKRKLPAQPNLNTFYANFFVGATTSESGFQTGSLQFEQKSDTEVIIYGFFADYPVVANYDAAKMTLTINNNQVMCPAELFGGEDLVLKLADDDMNEVSSISFTYDPEGTQTVTNTKTEESYTINDGLWKDNNTDIFIIATVASVWTDKRAYCFRYFNTPYSLDEAFPTAGNFTFDASEWEAVGDSEFSDGWFANPLINDGALMQAYKVKTYRNVEEPSVFLLSQPYGTNSIMAQAEGQDTPDAEGYIYIDATDPDCVLVRPHIASGLTCLDIFDTTAALTCTNYEGVAYYIDETDIEDLKEEAEMFDDELANMSAEGLIVIPRCRFQTVQDFYTENYWIVSRENPIPMEMRATIQLPEGALGVQGIIDDANNAPVKYYNLQGVEVANPEKNQIVIKTQGSKSSKMIVK